MHARLTDCLGLFPAGSIGYRGPTPSKQRSKSVTAVRPQAKEAESQATSKAPPPQAPHRPQAPHQAPQAPGRGIQPKGRGFSRQIAIGFRSDRLLVLHGFPSSLEGIGDLRWRLLLCSQGFTDITWLMIDAASLGMNTARGVFGPAKCSIVMFNPVGPGKSPVKQDPSGHGSRSPGRRSGKVAFPSGDVRGEGCGAHGLKPIGCSQ